MLRVAAVWFVVSGVWFPPSSLQVPDHEGNSNSGLGLICWTCSKKTTNEECNRWAPNIKCEKNFTFCKTIHRFDRETGSSLAVDKLCASSSSSSSSTVDECSVDQIGCRPHSFAHRSQRPGRHWECVSCCDHSYCNEAVPMNETEALSMSTITNGSPSLRLKRLRVPCGRPGELMASAVATTILSRLLVTPLH